MESRSRGSMDIQEYFARISYRGSHNKPDLATMSDIFQHHIQAVPFENLSIHCGESIELDLEATYNKIHSDQPQTPGVFRFQEESGTWYLEKVKRKQCVLNQSTSTSHSVENEVCRRVYLFTLQPRDIEEFRGCNAHLQTAPDSLFVTKSICSLQTADGIRALVGWKLTEIKYNYRDNMDLVEIRIIADEEMEKTLKEKFNITLDKKFVPVNTSRLSLF
ncbi:PREDICTED: arylamine N-acetyltransferase, pineal gland isozyme NAT-3-like [Corvus brachyrhynchos]|uniref:arylamine N-acetyltransferase, pineal gland isozyme NAT-3-like n=1 Tax=Corvus brachyrhynchos TaxID=85066 RepID=UPI0008163662|nr:PREDICTED: arylamine N-acetyltransferase, pineal gland isozyme NAT-3-like [Corvus brachyrhynchos]